MAIPRFSLAQLFASIPVLALALTQPFLLVIILPTLGAWLLCRAVGRSAAPTIAHAVLSIALGPLWSYDYWNYPFSQPRLLPSIREIVAVEKIADVQNLNPAKNLLPTAVPFRTFPHASELYWNTPIQLSATHRILKALGEKKIPAESIDALTSQQLNAIWTAADKSGILVHGESGYENTKTLRGYAGIARTADQKRFTFATLIGYEESNDHYPYYELVFDMNDNELVLSDWQWFYEDIAGIEGATWVFFADAAYILTLPVGLASLWIWPRIQRLARRMCSRSHEVKQLTETSCQSTHAEFARVTKI